VICVLHLASRGGMVSDGAFVGLGSGTGDGVVLGAPAGGVRVGVVTAGLGWQAAARTASTARPRARLRIYEAIQPRPTRGSGAAARLGRCARRWCGSRTGSRRRSASRTSRPAASSWSRTRYPLVAALARAVAAEGFYALRFNFRGVGASAGAWTGGTEEWRDIGDAVAHARAFAPALPAGVTAYSFGALMALRWLAEGGRVDGLALVGVPLRSVSLAPQRIPPVPDGTFIVAGEHDQFGTAAELRAALPRARIVEVKGADHFFARKRDEVGRLVAGELARTLASMVP
jgi:alpha/beta superfamily hydrolase